jgi:D-glycero-D-manno-heptose 1,7-bisphosphate phosphatase
VHFVYLIGQWLSQVSIFVAPGCPVRTDTDNKSNCYHNGVNNEFSVYPFPIHTVFLDRDGVINEKLPEGRYVSRWGEFQVLPGVVEAIGLLNRAGIRVVVVSNQRGVALGLYTAEDVRAIHAEFQKMLEAHGARVDRFYFCPHDKGLCNCRKPLGGMFDQAVQELPSTTAATSAIIGDSISDIQFGHRLGMTTVFLETTSELQAPGAEVARDLADLRFTSLLTAVRDLVARQLDRRHASGSGGQGANVYRR